MTTEICGLPVIHAGKERPAGFEDHGTGYAGRDLDLFPRNGLACCRAPSIQMLTEDQQKQRSEAVRAGKGAIWDICERVQLPPKDQDQSSYCHVHAPTHGMELDYVLAGGQKIILSAFKAGSDITGGKNVGGSGIRDVKYLAEFGTCVEADWPPMKFKGQFTDEIKANSLLHRIEFWEEFEPDDHDSIRSALAQNQPLTVGIPAWSHEVILVGCIFYQGRWYYVFRQSWGAKYGKYGFAILPVEYMKFDEVGRIASVTQSAA